MSMAIENGQRKLAVVAAVMAGMGSLPVPGRYTVPPKPKSPTLTGRECPACGSRHVYAKFAQTRCLNCQHRW